MLHTREQLLSGVVNISVHIQALHPAPGRRLQIGRLRQLLRGRLRRM